LQKNIGDEPEFQNIINEQSPNSVEFTSDVDMVVKDADIILLATSSFGFLLNIDKLKLNAFVCDVSMPPNVSKDELCNRPDVQIYSGGRARLDFFNLIKGRAWEELFNRNEVYGCLAEGITLALDNQYLNFSIGKRQITLEGLDRIKEMANRNGIKVAV
jgi:predicted amino acid dehydrogenase